MPDFQFRAEPPLLSIERPYCRRCQARMMLTRISPEPEGYDIRTFECAKCRHNLTVKVGHDPMKSHKAGWTAGELKPPQ